MCPTEAVANTIFDASHCVVIPKPVDDHTPDMDKSRNGDMHTNSQCAVKKSQSLINQKLSIVLTPIEMMVTHDKVNK